MGIPPLFPLHDPPEAADAKARDSQGGEILNQEPFREEEFRAEALRESDRQQFMRRLRWLLIAGISSFVLVIWILARTTGSGEFIARGSDPISVVRAELDSLANGDLQSAYAQLSERYRKQVSFEDYHALVASHRRMFLTHEFRVTRRDQYKGQTFIEAQLTSETGQHFVGAIHSDPGGWALVD